MIARLALVVAGLSLALAASAQDTATPTEATPATPRTGPEIFAETCVHCHNARGWGTRSLARRTPPGQAELLQRQVLPPALVRHAVRRGIGSMPQFTPTEISDEELEVLADWLDSLN
ncbi:MAG TPA: cytochrome c [Paracoccaceae bacterium]|nr:cytochrome c [Paracoccaceae bacterium]